MKKHLSLIGAGLLALLSACSNDVIDAGDPLIETRGTLRVLVKDATTGAALSEVAVKLADGKTATTGENGIAVLEGIYVGTQAAELSKDGYAGAIYPISIQGSGNEGVFIAEDETRTISLYKKEANLEGYLFYEDRNGKQLPAKDAEVRITLSSSSFLERTLIAKADADGKYSFIGLPAIGISYSLTMLQKDFNGETYKEHSLSPASLTAGKTAISNPAIYSYSKAVKPLFTLSYTDSIKTGAEDIVFTFSDTVDIASGSFNSNVNYVCTINSCDAIWSEGNKKLTLKLWPGHKWKNDINFSSSLYSDNGAFLDVEATIKLKKIDLRGLKVAATKVEVLDLMDSIVVVDTATVVSDLTDVRVTWTHLEGAKSYAIYAKASKGNGKVTNVSNNYSITAADTLSAGKPLSYTLRNLYSYHVLGFESGTIKPFVSGGQIDFYVVAIPENGEYATRLTDTTPITLKAAP